MFYISSCYTRIYIFLNMTVIFFSLFPFFQYILLPQIPFSHRVTLQPCLIHTFSIVFPFSVFPQSLKRSFCQSPQTKIQIFSEPLSPHQRFHKALQLFLTTPPPVTSPRQFTFHWTPFFCPSFTLDAN